MLSSWQNDHERIRTAPFPEQWLDILQNNVPHYTYLSETEQEVLQGDLRIFIAAKYWEGCGGLELTDEIQVTIAAQASLLTLCLPHNHYPGGVVTEGYDERLGEAWHIGPVVLSWSDSKAGGENPADGRNVVFHEFAHKLDILDGTVDGFPRLHDDASYHRWHAVMSEEWEVLVEGGRATILDHYGSTNPGELFAVSVEAFFEKPRQMRSRHPRLYQVLKEYFRQDPGARLDALSLRETI
jgi:Mlc titration factor MtfA (ptsG expression regulator)